MNSVQELRTSDFRPSNAIEMMIRLSMSAMMPLGEALVASATIRLTKKSSWPVRGVG